MNEVLTFRSPPLGPARVAATPSPTLELAYAYYRLRRPDQPRSRDELPWLEGLQEAQPEVIEGVRELWKTEGEEASFDLFWFTCEMGFAALDSVAPMFAGFAAAIDPFIERVKVQQARISQEAHEHGSEYAEKYAALLARLSVLRRAKPRARFLGALRRLWAALEPLWLSEGRAEAQRGVEQFNQKFASSGNVLESLPAHHFVQFEGSAQHIRASLERGRLLVVPLYFAAGGGFNLDFLETHVLGYGIRSDLEFERLQTQASAVALPMKALGDPTRLLLLTLLARYSNFALTVSDLATQLGVSQPTVSAHLKLLKEQGLVTLERQGTKSLYRVNEAALTSALTNLRQLLRLSEMAY